MPARPTLPGSYFEDIFAGDEDPWSLESSAYEQAKYDQTLGALPRTSYRSALEVGCAKGVLTARLARRCEALIAIDVSQTALTAAAIRCADQVQVTFELMLFPQQTPNRTDLDLVVLSEVVYYWDEADTVLAGAWLLNAVAPGGDLVLVHWTGETDYPQSGDQAVQTLHAALGAGVRVLTSRRSETYRLDLWRRV